MHVHRLLIVVVRHVFDGPDLNDPGVVDEHIDASEVLHRGFNGVFDVLPIAHVAHDCEYIPAISIKLGFRPAELFPVASQ